WLLHGAASTRLWPYLIAAPVALAALVLTNWPGTTGLAMAIAAYWFATLGSGWIRRTLTLLVIAAVAYAIASPWIPPSTIALVLRNAQQSDDTMLGPQRLLLLLGLAASMVIIHLLFRR